MEEDINYFLPPARKEEVEVWKIGAVINKKAWQKHKTTKTENNKTRKTNNTTKIIQNNYKQQNQEKQYKKYINKQNKSIPIQKQTLK